MSSNTRGAGKEIQTERGHRAQDIPPDREPSKDRRGDKSDGSSTNERCTKDEVQWR